MLYVLTPTWIILMGLVSPEVTMKEDRFSNNKRTPRGYDISTTPLHLPTLTLPLNTVSLTDPCRGSSMSPPITPPTADDGQTHWTLSLFQLFSPTYVVHSSTQNQIKMLWAWCPAHSEKKEKKKKKATNIKLHPAVYTLIPSHAYMHPPPSLQCSARGQGSTPCSEKCWCRSNKPPLLLLPLFLPFFFPISFNNNFSFKFSENTHTEKMWP